MDPRVVGQCSAWSDVEAIAGANALDALDGPVETASALPNACYTSAAWQKLEFERLFARSWFVVGFVQDVPEPGDAMPVEPFGTPLLVLRDLDGGIRVFHNVCPHRRTILVTGKRSGLRELAGPCHGWSYDLDGSLRDSPHVDCGSPHDDAPGLVPVRSEVWHHWIFVNLDGKAQALEDYLAPATDLVRGYDLGATRYAGTAHFEIAANWKLALENYIEPYHVFSAHPRLHDFVSMSERMPSRIDRHVMWNRYDFGIPEPGRGEGLPYFPNLSVEAARQVVWFILPTAFGVEFHPDHVASFHLAPVAPDRCRERIDVYVVGDAATSPDWAEGRQATLDMWDELNHEDIGLIESMQRGRTSPAYDGGSLSAYWDEAPLHLNRMVVEGMR
ncbi:MAG: aromatic ring-hydroxylating dioxygenase subunit alpha [bacterium]|nr:aromatic ring-hydroxylating dioxygenase subunit alpha [bacterium]